MEGADQLRESLHALPGWVRRSGQDYLTQDRLTRRLRIGETIYGARLLGYRDHYTVWTTHDKGNVWSTYCDCDRRERPCPHGAALLLDLSQSRPLYQEAPWRLAVQATALLASWPFAAGLDWHLIPEGPSRWRNPFAPEGVILIGQLLERQPKQTPRLHRDSLTALWAEMHPSWNQDAVVREYFHRWLAPYLEAPLQDFSQWALLHWMQPQLDLSSLFLGLEGQPATLMLEALLRQLCERNALIQPNVHRHRALLSDMTLIRPGFTSTLWDIFDDSERGRLAQADALYLADQKSQAINLLETALPQEPGVRRQARIRLIQWLDESAGLPHRLALAWDAGSPEELAPVRHLFTTQQWETVLKALQTEKGGLSTGEMG